MAGAGAVSRSGGRRGTGIGDGRPADAAWWNEPAAVEEATAGSRGMRGYRRAGGSTGVPAETVICWAGSVVSATA
jgi:hypothetical protein